MAKKNIVTKIFAFLALFWIFIWILGTAILFIMSPRQEITTEYSAEDLQKMIDSGYFSWNIFTWTTDNQIDDILSATGSIEISNWTWEIEK